MAKATGFDDGTELVVDGEAKGALELSDREKAIAQGLDPDAVGAEDAEEEGDEAEGTEAAVKDDDASGEEGTEAPGSDWVDEDVKALAESYGIDEEGLASFEDESDFKRFASIFEKHLAATDEKPADEKPKKAPKEETPEEPDADAPDVKWFEENGYDEQTVNIVKSVLKGQGVVKGLMGRIEQLEQRLKDGDQRREQDALSVEIDAIGGRFGKGENLTSAQKKARAKLIDAVEVVSQTMERRKEKASRAVVLKRAEFVAFGDEILAEERAKHQEALVQGVKKQSAKRRSVGRNTKPPARRERPGEAEDPVKAIANMPELVALWNDGQD
jgi:hypothetical protein